MVSDSGLEHSDKAEPLTKRLGNLTFMEHYNLPQANRPDNFADILNDLSLVYDMENFQFRNTVSTMTTMLSDI